VLGVLNYIVPIFVFVNVGWKLCLKIELLLFLSVHFIIYVLCAASHSGRSLSEGFITCAPLVKYENVLAFVVIAQALSAARLPFLSDQLNHTKFGLYTCCSACLLQRKKMSNLVCSRQSLLEDPSECS
jgi:hypothetical protein